MKIYNIQYVGYLFKLLIAFLFIFQTNAQSLSTEELKCLTDLSSKLGFSVSNCDGAVVICNQIDTEYHVTQIYIKQTNTNTLDFTDITCFPSLTNFEITSGNIAPNFLSNTFQDSLAFIKLTNCIGSQQQFNLPIFPKLRNLMITFDSIVNLEINLSNLQTLSETLYFYFSSSTIQNLSSLKLINDLASPLNLRIFYIYSNYIPDLTNVYVSAQFLIQVTNPPSNGYGNFKTFGCMSSCIFYLFYQNPFDFPLEFGDIRAIGQYSDISIFFSKQLKKPSSYIDLSKTGFLSLDFKEVGTNFNIDGNVPIIFPQTLQGFSISYGSYSNIPSFDGTIIAFLEMNSCDLKLNFSNYNAQSFPPTLKELSLPNNQITGTIDKSLCPLFLKLNNNSLTGPLPSCIACYYNSFYVYPYFKNNAFEEPPLCTSIVPKVTINDYNIFITGNDIGYGSTSVTVNNPPLVSPYILTYSYLNGNYYGYSVGLPNGSLLTITFPTNPPQTLTVSANETIAPIVSLVKPVENQQNTFIFEGQYFTYNSSIIQVTIDSQPCNIISTSFYNFTCIVSLGLDLSKRRVVSYITINQKVQTQITILDLTTSNIIKSCSNDCGNEYCLSDIGQCGCLFDCLNGGTCDSSKSKCKCPVNWVGDSCQIPVHYVSAVTPSSIQGGEAKIFGFFGSIHRNLSVIIGDKPCFPIILNSSDTIMCKAAEGYGIKDLNITQNGISFYGKNMYSYINPVLKCPNDCTSKDNGICNTDLGECNCKENYSGFDCSNLKNQNSSPNSGENNNKPINLPDSITRVNNESAVTRISNQETFYEISITELHEVSISGEIINKFDLIKKWDISNDLDSKSYKFKQQLGNSTISTITYIIQEISETSKFTFADIPFTLDAGSIKISVIIENFQFENSLSTLSLYFNTAASTISQNQNKCNQKDTEIDTSNVNNDQMLNSYISISKNSKVLSGRFINRALSDGKSTFISSTIVSKSSDSLLVSLNLPHCKERCELDPDFSVLVSPEFKECQDSNKRSWVIPVSVVVPCVFVVVLVVVIALIARKNRSTFLLIKNHFVNNIKSSKKQDLFMPGENELKKV